VSDNVELVKRSFEAIRSWDIEGLLRLCHPEIRFMPLTGTRVESGGYIGHAGVRAYLTEAQELWDVLEPDGNRFEDLGDRVVVLGTCRVRGRASGAETTPACAWVMHVSDGLIVSHRAFSAYEEAEKAAGVERAG
jgi:ketosteroid isomerase-like protein